MIVYYYYYYYYCYYNYFKTVALQPKSDFKRPFQFTKILNLEIYYKKYRKYTQTAQLCKFYEDIYTSPTPQKPNKCHEMTTLS